MKRLLLGSVAAAALSSAALATDITPVFEVLPPAEATPYNWTGYYGRMNKLSPADTLMLSAPIGGTAADGFIASTQFGYNYQKGPFVLGIEGDMRRRGADLVGTGGLDLSGFRSESGWIGTLRPRAGVAAENWLFYGTGGVTYSGNDGETRPGFTPAPRAGWTVGGGVEYSSGKQWSLGLEYLYADFGKSAQGQSGAAFSTGAASAEDHNQILRGRLNYRFGWDGPQK
jgi:outer membrane immunogenic protein